MLTEDIILKRTPEVETNVPHQWIHHSPDGFEWGYGGSGPADLALNILLMAGLDKNKSWRLHQDFKWKFIATMSHEGGILKKEEINKWIESHLQEIDIMDDSGA